MASYTSKKNINAHEVKLKPLPVDILRHLMERTYVLAGIGERIFGFVHRTFMEYFAACHCKEQFNKSKSDFNWLNKEIFGAHWNESEWEEVLLLLIAMLHDQKTPIHEIIEHLGPEITDYTASSSHLPHSALVRREIFKIRAQGSCVWMDLLICDFEKSFSDQKSGFEHGTLNHLPVLHH